MKTFINHIACRFDWKKKKMIRLILYWIISLEGMGGIYLIFVIFWAAPHYFGPSKGHQKCINSLQKSQNGPK